MSNPATKIGPGRLVLVVGPSGAGKDTLIAGARAALAGNPDVVFARRVVTRPVTDSEDHDSLGEVEFLSAASRGAFAFSWQAHGLHYGIPASVNDDISAGRTVVCNTSRGALPRLAECYARPIVVLVTVPDDVLAARLAARGRESGEDREHRAGRAGLFDDVLRPDFTISNVHDPAVGIEALVSVILGRRPCSDFAYGFLF